MKSSLSFLSLGAPRSARPVTVAAISLLVAIVAFVSLRGVSADTLGKFGITAQSRAGKLIGKIAPQAFASKSTETAQGEAALKVLKDRGQYASLRQAMETARYRAMHHHSDTQFQPSLWNDWLTLGRSAAGQEPHLGYGLAKTVAAAKTHGHEPRRCLS